MNNSEDLGVSDTFIEKADDCIGISYDKLRLYIKKYSKMNIYVTDYDDFLDYFEATQSLRHTNH